MQIATPIFSIALGPKSKHTHSMVPNMYLYRQPKNIVSKCGEMGSRVLNIGRMI